MADPEAPSSASYFGGKNRLALYEDLPVCDQEHEPQQQQHTQSLNERFGLFTAQRK